MTIGWRWPSDFWTEVSKLIPDWHRAKAGEVSPAELRKNFVHAHAIALAALARAGKSLIKSTQDRGRNAWLL